MHVVEYFSVDYRTFPSMHILYTLFYIQKNALAVAVDALVVGVPRTSQVHLISCYDVYNGEYLMY